MISGEYVVLEGAVALVAAVDARVVASSAAGDRSAPDPSRSPQLSRLPPEALLARQLAERALGAVPMELQLDATALQASGRKLGLGSSAAQAAAAAGWVAAAHGLDPAESRAQILGWALEGHRAVAPGGSGADVAASVLGGVVRFQRDTPASSARWPAGLVSRVVWTESPARTSELVARVASLRSNQDRYRAALAPLVESAARMLAGFEDGDVAEVVRAAAAHGDAMAKLGEAAGAPIVTEALARVARIAKDCGGAAKPSGAGGGDVALALFADAADAERFDRACAREGLNLLSLRLGAEGVRREAS